jgi:[2Fe-2S] binding domain
VTPVRRVAGRSVTTLDGLDPQVLSVLTESFCATGASQCGFCTPGILMRLAGLMEKKPSAGEQEVSTALAAHLCRCTGWKTIHEAFFLARGRIHPGSDCSEPVAERDLEAASVRAGIEGRTQQAVGPEVAAGLGGFADDLAPRDALVAVPEVSGGWSVAPTLTAARAKSKKVQGRNSGSKVTWPLEIPEGAWALSLATTFVEPAYLEPDSSFCLPGGEPASPVANGGAFGAKTTSPVVAAASELAASHGLPVRVSFSREDVVRLGPKRPPIAAGLRPDGSGLVRVGRTPSSGDLSDWVSSFSHCAPDCEVEVIDIPGPPVSSDPRGAGWAEAAVLLAALESMRGGDGPPTAEARSPEGGRARVSFADGRFSVTVDAGEVLDEVVLRSYCIGAVHQAFGWVTREAIAVDPSGQVLDLTIRSFGVLSARETPDIDVEVRHCDGPAVNASDAVFAAAAAAAWIAGGLGPRWPTAG